MSKLTTALWKGLKHGFSAGVANVAATALAGNHQTNEIVTSFAVGFLVGIGINVKAVKAA